MTESNEPKDPWADLAESLGAEPAADTPPPAARPSPPPAKPAPSRAPAARPAKKADWNDVAGSLGLPPAAAETTAPPPPPPAPSPQRPATPVSSGGFGAGLLDEQSPSREPGVPGTERRPAGKSAGEKLERPAERPPTAAAEPATPAAVASDGGTDEAAGDQDEPRRRRRRRGGRGRGRRGERRERADETALGQDAESPPGYGRNLDEEREERRSGPASVGGLKADVRPHAPWEDEFGRGLDDEAEDLLDDEPAVASPATPAERSGDAAEAEDSDGRPRRRRRRRRGRRSRDDAEDGESVPRQSADEQGDAGPADDARADRGEAPTETTGDDDEPVRRRRRRRRRRPAEAADDAGEATAERRPRRAADEPSGSRRRPAKSSSRRRGTSRSGDADETRRRRRETFSRVGEGRDEDDEGLEFLGMDETAGGTAGGQPDSDQELLSESGLDSVRDVPSWVEAIGIVIAGNMDSRKQPPKA